MATQFSADKLQQLQCDALNLKQLDYTPAMEVEPESSDLEHHPDDTNANKNKEEQETCKQEEDD
eukprot:6236337-Ditylum_brightwellii.AAC.1